MIVDVAAFSDQQGNDIGVCVLCRGVQQRACAEFFTGVYVGSVFD